MKNGTDMNNKQYRMRELLNPVDGCSLVVDTSNGLVFGALPGLEQFSEAIIHYSPYWMA